jgi:hypothetical protein
LKENSLWLLRKRKSNRATVAEAAHEVNLILEAVKRAVARRVVAGARARAAVSPACARERVERGRIQRDTIKAVLSTLLRRFFLLFIECLLRLSFI